MPTAAEKGAAPDTRRAAPHVTLAGYTLSRRRFVAALGVSYASGVGTALAGGYVVRPLGAQEPAPPGADVARAEGSQAVAMNQDAAKTVRRPPKPGATPQVTREQRDALENAIKCQCSCTLDVYTCRTTDFSCQVSPAMHRDVMSLVEGGHTADEILAAFSDVYGEKVLMSPKREGFNLAGYWMPFAALGTGAVVLATLIRRWGQRAAVVNAAHAAHRGHTAGNGGRPGSANGSTNGSTNGAMPYPDDATPEELARLEAAVRGEEPR
jgi:cytochrome c-type biogenesis protein CcmH